MAQPLRQGCREAGIQRHAALLPEPQDGGCDAELGHARRDIRRVGRVQRVRAFAPLTGGRDRVLSRAGPVPVLDAGQGLAHGLDVVRAAVDVVVSDPRDDAVQDRIR